MAESEPVVGIGVPVFNGELYLAETLASLRAQDFTDFEVVVVDNASTDSTPDIVRSVAAADPRFRYVRHDRNIGILANFNAAFRLTRGEFHLWAANDTYDPRFLTRCLELLGGRPDAVAATTTATTIDADGNPVEVVTEDVRWDHPDPVVRFLDFASYRHHCLACYALMRRAVVEQTGLMPPFWGSDRLFLAELAIQGPLLLDPESLFFSRSHEDFKSDFRRPPVSYLIGMERPRALTVYYGRQLARSLERLPIDPAVRRRARRALARWAWENRVQLTRSAVRGGVEVVRSAATSRSRRVLPARPAK